MPNDLYEVHGTHPDCEHRRVVHLSESPLWECPECEGQMPIRAWHKLWAAKRANGEGPCHDV